MVGVTVEELTEDDNTSVKRPLNTKLNISQDPLHISVEILIKTISGTN